MGNKKSRPKLKEEDVHFLIAQTSFTRKQIKQWYKGYLRDCPNGMLTRDKFMEVYAEFFPSGNAKKFCEHVFRTFDSDNSGQIDFREFLLAINITSSTDPREKLNWAFSMYDIDGNGTIDKNEMTEIISTIYSMVGDTVEIQRDDTPSKRTEEIFQKMDTNKDDVLTKKEFVEGCLAEPTIRQMLLAETAQQPV